MEALIKSGKIYQRFLVLYDDTMHFNGSELIVLIKEALIKS